MFLWHRCALNVCLSPLTLRSNKLFCHEKKNSSFGGALWVQTVNKYLFKMLNWKMQETVSWSGGIYEVHSSDSRPFVRTVLMNGSGLVMLPVSDSTNAARQNPRGRASESQRHRGQRQNKLGLSSLEWRRLRGNNDWGVENWQVWIR